MNVQDNIRRAASARKAVEKHCLAASITEDRHHLLVTFPPGYFPEGVRVSKANGAAWAYEKALEKMESTWQKAQL